MICTLLVGCSYGRDYEARVPSSSRNFEGKNFQDVIRDLERAGFTNIKTEIIYDLITGWLISDGSVNNVSINGNTSFSSDSWFPKNAKIIVTYHTFAKNAPNGDNAEHESDDNNSEPEVNINEQPPDSVPDSIAAPPPPVDDYILTKDNNSDFAVLLETYIPGNEEVEAFVEKYLGRTIEFDGHVFMSARKFHGMFETPPSSLHVFFWNGDSEEADRIGYHYGPEYFMERVRINSFPLIEREGANVRVVATIDGVGYTDDYSVDAAYIILSPVSIETRTMQTSSSENQHPASIDSIMSVLEESLRNSFGTDFMIGYDSDSKLMLIALWFEGYAAISVLASQGNAEAIERWNVLREGAIGMANNTKSLVEGAGDTETNVG
jgi:hypothetical protein